MPSTSVCSGSGIGVAQVRPNVPKFVTVAMEPPVASAGSLRCARQFDQFVVARDQFLQRLFVRVAHHRHQHAVLGFDGEADVNRATDARFCCRPAGRRARCFPPAPSPARARRKAPGRALGSQVLRCASNGVERTPAGRRWRAGRVQLRRMASATATRMDEAWLILCFSRLRDEFLEILDGHAPRRAAAGDAGEIGGVQAEFVHARLEPRRKIACARGIRRHRQTAHGRLHASSLRRFASGFASAVGVGGFWPAPERPSPSARLLPAWPRSGPAPRRRRSFRSIAR